MNQNRNKGKSWGKHSPYIFFKLFSEHLCKQLSSPTVATARGDNVYSCFVWPTYRYRSHTQCDVNISELIRQVYSHSTFSYGNSEELRTFNSSAKLHCTSMFNPLSQRIFDRLKWLKCWNFNVLMIAWPWLYNCYPAHTPNRSWVDSGPYLLMPIVEHDPESTCGYQ